jgi:hypothetical protein
LVISRASHSFRPGRTRFLYVHSIWPTYKSRVTRPNLGNGLQTKKKS